MRVLLINRADTMHTEKKEEIYNERLLHRTKEAEEYHSCHLL